MSQSHALDCISHEQDSIPLLKASKKKKKEVFLSWLTQNAPYSMKNRMKNTQIVSVESAYWCNNSSFNVSWFLLQQ